MTGPTPPPNIRDAGRSCVPDAGPFGPPGRPLHPMGCIPGGGCHEAVAAATVRNPTPLRIAWRRWLQHGCRSRSPTPSTWGTPARSPWRSTFLTNKEVAKEFFDREGNVLRTLTTGALKVQVTNLDTGKSLDLNISGPGVTLPDGDLDQQGDVALLLHHRQPPGPGTRAHRRPRPLGVESHVVQGLERACRRHLRGPGRPLILGPAADLHDREAPGDEPGACGAEQGGLSRPAGARAGGVEGGGAQPSSVGPTSISPDLMISSATPAVTSPDPAHDAGAAVHAGLTIAGRAHHPGVGASRQSGSARVAVAHGHLRRDPGHGAGPPRGMSRRRRYGQESSRRRRRWAASAGKQCAPRIESVRRAPRDRPGTRLQSAGSASGLVSQARRRRLHRAGPRPFPGDRGRRRSSVAA